MADQTSSLIVRLIDQVTGPAKGVASAIKGIGDASKRASGVTFADRLDAAIARNNARISNYRGQVVDAIATLYTLKRALSAPINDAMEMESALTEIGNKSGMAADELKALGKQAMGIGSRTNQFSSEILKGADILIGFGMDAKTATASLETIGKTATATGASIDDLSKLGFAAVSNLNVPVDQLAASFDVLDKAGKMGGFELKDMARYFPTLGAAAQAMGQNGVKAVTDLGAALQIVRRGTGTSEEAATALANLYQKMRAPLTAKNFKKYGINIRKEITKGVAAGKSPVEVMIEQANKAIKKGAVLEDLFADKQVQEAMRPLIKNFEDYLKLRAEAGNASGTVDQDFANKMKTNAERMKAFKVAMSNLSTTIGNALLPALTSIAKWLAPIVDKIGAWAEKHPKLTAAIVGSIAGFLALNAVLAMIKYSSALGYGGVLSLVKGVTTLAAGTWKAAAGQVALQNALGAMSGQKLTAFQTITTGLKGMALAVPGVSGLAGAMTAIGGAIAAVSAPVWLGIAVAVGLVAAAAFSLWKYWDRISSFVGGFASQLMTELQPAFDALEPVMAPIKTLAQGIGDGFKWASDKISEFMGWLSSFFEKETLTDGQKEKYRQSGADLAKSMIEAIKTAFNDLMTWFSELPSRIVAAIGQIDLSGILKWPSMPTWLGGSGGAPASTSPANDNAIQGPMQPAKRARGGPVSRGRSYLVGEQRPEVFTPRANGYISQAKGGAGGATIAPTFNLTFNGSVDQATVDKIKSVLREEVRQAFRGVYADAGMRFA